MRKIKMLLPVLLCAILLLGCFALPLGPERPEPVPSTEPVTVTVTHPETRPVDTQPTETTATIPPTEGPHSPLYLSELPVEDVIDFFNEVCLSAEYVNSGDPSVVQKWTGPLIYQVHGDATDEDLMTVACFTEELNRVHGFPGIREARYPEEATLDIHFCSQQEFLDLMGDNFYGADGGVTFWYEEDEIYYAIIGIRTDLDQELRNSVILEELYNGLGPVQDTVHRSDSIIYSGFSQPQELTPVDWLILELLYHPDMKCSMTRQQCEAVIRGLYY